MTRWKMTVATAAALSGAVALWGCGGVEDPSDELGSQTLAATYSIAQFTNTYAGYNSNTGQCQAYRMTGYRPVGTTKFPLFIYLVGSLGSYTNAPAMAYVQQMAKKGHVAASVEYFNPISDGCTEWGPRINSIVGTLCGSTNSAVYKLVNSHYGDQAKGITVAGLSQGGHLSILAKNYNSNVTAAHAMAAFRQDSCLVSRSLPGNRLRINNGASDELAGDATAQRPKLNALTGRSCSTGTSCYATDGSGWKLALNLNVKDLCANHNYISHNATSPCSGTETTSDANWLGTADWGMQAGATWLDKYTY